ncbi:MAG: glycosyltransferase [Actinomycetota bacterium]|nr:glycosyltransferase [Actinomycetota bacterium]
MSPLPVSLSVVVPCYDEERRIGGSLQVLVTTLADMPVNGWEVVVVDDRSTDRTAAIVSAAAADEPRVRLVSTARGKGKGAAVRAGALAATGEAVLVIDADLAADLAVLPEMLRAVAAGDADAVLGSRLIAGAQIEPARNIGRRVAAAAFRAAVRVVTPLRVSDPQCGCKLFRGDVLREHAARLQTDGYAYEVELLLRLHAAGATIREVPVRWCEGGDSKVRVVHDGVAMFADLWRARRRAQR